MSGAISISSKVTAARWARFGKQTAAFVALFATLGFVLGVPVPALAGEPLSILGYTRSVSFWMNIPEGWRSDSAAAKRLGAIFVLVPQRYTFDNAPAVMTASSYTKASVATAMATDRAAFIKHAPDIHIVNRNAIMTKAGGKFLVRQFRSHLLEKHGQGYESVAYHQQGPDTIVITLSAYTKSQYRKSLRTFVRFVETYEASSLKVTVDK